MEELKMESPLLVNSVTNIIGKSGESTIFGFGDGSSGPARAGENHLWDDEDDDTSWDNL